jgi:iron complex outermembrane receptor protein
MSFYRSRGRRLAGISRLFAAILVLCLAPSAARAQQVPPPNGDLKKLSLSQLADLEVSSVSRSDEVLGEAAAAVAVLTNEDIRRSGATTVPEALRRIPGLNVARQTSNAWAISSRGFSNVNSEKLLVLSDTRSLYTPLYSGVFWNAQDYLLQDIERIEVIRGPGATLWGSNAVNGVINITTKRAKDTQGLYAETSGGNEERYAAAARYGGTIGTSGYYRVFGQYADRDATFHPAISHHDAWHLGHVGARADWDLDANHSFTIQGEAYDGTIGLVAPSVSVSGRTPAPGDQVAVGGGNVLARWMGRTRGGSDYQVRAYYDRTNRDDPSFHDALDTFDVDVQQRLTLAVRHEVTWGGSYRLTANRNDGKGVFALNPPASRDQLAGGFVQDQVRLSARTRLTVGTKLEHNDFSGFEVQPSGRVAWDVSPRQFAWAALSHAVRVPTRLERDFAIDASNPAGDPVVRLLGNPAFGAERLLAYEVGYRWRPRRFLFIDLAGFHNRYRGLASLEFGDRFRDPLDGRTIIPILNQNLTDGHAQGVEALVTYTPVPSWRLTASSTSLYLTLQPGGQDLNRGRFLDGATPHHQLGIQSFLDLPAHLQLDVMIRQLTDLRRLPSIATGEGIPGYTELDLRMAWRVWKQIEFSISGQNLLHDHHVEFGPPASRGEIERSVHAKVAVGF